MIFYLASRHDSDEAVSFNEDTAIITKEDEKVKENYRRHTLDDEVHSGRTKRRYDDNDLDNDTFSKKQKISSPSTFYSGIKVSEQYNIRIYIFFF